MKCGRTAEEAAEFRERYPDDVTVSHYIGRYGWNSVRYSGGSVPDDEVRELLDRSYDAIVAKLPKSRRPAHRSGREAVGGRVGRPRGSDPSD